MANKRGGSARKRCLFQASGISERWGNLPFGSVKGPKGLTDESYGFIKLRKRSIFVIDSYLNDSAFTAVKRVAKF